MKQYLNAIALGNGKAVVEKVTVTRAEDGRLNSHCMPGSKMTRLDFSFDEPSLNNNMAK